MLDLRSKSCYATLGRGFRTMEEALGHQNLKSTAVCVSLAREVMNKEMQEHGV